MKMKKMMQLVSVKKMKVKKTLLKVKIFLGIVGSDI